MSLQQEFQEGGRVEIARLQARIAELEADCANWERVSVQTTNELGAEVARLRETATILLDEADDATDDCMIVRRSDVRRLREALAGGGQKPNPAYPRGNDDTDGLEDGHWAVEDEQEERRKQLDKPEGLDRL